MTSAIHGNNDPLSTLNALLQQSRSQDAAPAGEAKGAPPLEGPDLQLVAQALQQLLAGGQCEAPARVWLDKAKPLGCDMTRAVALGDTMYLHDPHRGLCAYDAKSDVWTNHGYAPLASRHRDNALMQSGLGVHQGRIIVAGGNAGKSCSARTVAGIAAYDPKSGAFEELPVKQGKLTPAAAPAVASEGDRIYLLGGAQHGKKDGLQSYAGPRSLKSGQVYDVEHCTVKDLPEMSRPRQQASAMVVDRQLVVVGGAERKSGTFEIYDLDAEKWAGPFPMPFNVRNASLSLQDGKLLVEGGQSLREMGNCTDLRANERAFTIDLDTKEICMQTSLPIANANAGVVATLQSGDKVAASYANRKVRTQLHTAPESSPGFDGISILNAFNTTNIDRSTQNVAVEINHVTKNDFSRTVNETHQHDVHIDMSEVTHNHTTNNQFDVDKSVDLSLLRFGKVPGGSGFMGAKGWFCSLFDRGNKPRTGVRGHGANRVLFGKRQGGMGPLPKNTECYAFNPASKEMFAFTTNGKGCFELPIGEQAQGDLYVFTMQGGAPSEAVRIPIP